MLNTIFNYCSAVAASLTKAAAEEPTFFSVDNNTLKKTHSRVLGLLSYAAFEKGLKIDVERSWGLKKPIQGRKGRKQRQYAPDLTLYSSDDEVLGFVDYESADVTKEVLKKKAICIENIEGPVKSNQRWSYVFIVTMPDKDKWPGENGSIHKEDITNLEHTLCGVSKGRPDFTCFLMSIIDGHVQICVIEDGKLSRPH